VKENSVRLKGKVAIITGGARGIGRAYAVRFAEEGASIVIADVIDGTSVAEEIVNKGAKAVAVFADVSSEENTTKMAQTAMEHFGRIDILVNNAGVFAGLGK
jgi:NAD(P)-dependent dehydrogenase (short-subunit alcohol dehydrogenase family)